MNRPESTPTGPHGPIVTTRSRGHILGALLGLVPIGGTLYAQSDLSNQLRSALTDSARTGVRWSACVVDLQSGGVVFAENADEALTPASTMKVFPMAAAIVELGRGFTFDTLLATDGSNLYVIGGGDPAFGDERLHRARDEDIHHDLHQWADALLSHGISIVEGNLVIDESIFDAQQVHPTWEQSDLDNWYAAPIGGLNFNDNCVDITVSPAAGAGDACLVSWQPQTSLVHVTNRCRTGAEGTPVLHHPADTFEYIVSGRCAKRWPFGSVSFPDPGLLFADTFRSVLKSRGIEVNGRIERRTVRKRDGSLPPELTIVARRTTPLPDVLTRIGKNSQNLFADCLLKRLGYELSLRRGDDRPEGSWQTGRRAVLEFLKRAGIATDGLEIADGSGLSRSNRCSARHLASLLAWMQRRPEAEPFRESLSLAGVDGSLRKRLKDEPGSLFGKTGTMSGVRALTGYIDPGTGARFAFAVIHNGYRGSSTPYKKIHDQFCRVLLAASSDEP